MADRDESTDGEGLGVPSPEHGGSRIPSPDPEVRRPGEARHPGESRDLNSIPEAGLGSPSPENGGSGVPHGESRRPGESRDLNATPEVLARSEFDRASHLSDANAELTQPRPEYRADGASPPEHLSWPLRETAPEAVSPAVATLEEPPPANRVPGSAMLKAVGLVKVYRKRPVVDNVDLQVSQGEIVGLLGPNGAGKTTTFYMIVGLIAPDSGKVILDFEDLTNVPMYKRARKGVGYLAQEPSVFRKLTVEENVLAVLQMMGLSRREQQGRLEVLLDELGIKHLRASKGYALSGGERRRLEITRALVGQPKFMLLDEPFAGVDPIAVHDIQQIVAGLRRRNIGVLISDHNVEQTLDIVDRAYIMYEGGVHISGTVSELVWNDEVAEIYLGPTLTARMRQRYSYPE